MNRDALQRAAKALGCTMGRAMIVSQLMPRGAMRSVVNGSLKGLVEEWSLLKQREDELMILTTGSKHTHPPDLWGKLAKVSATGGPGV